MPMNRLTQQINPLLAVLSGAGRIFGMMNGEQKTDEGTVTSCNVCRDSDGTLRECDEFTQEHAWKEQDGDRLILLWRDARFNNVIFGYTKEETTLNGISLYAKPGQKIVFAGSTGAGKTTIINPVNRSYELDGGTITYDGIDIQDIKRDNLHRSLSMMIQDTHLFTDTIADDIRYGRLGATGEDVVNVAKVASAHSFTRRLPQGYDTVLHNDGSNLSQGQCQLLAITRAATSLLPVLILDGATSPIDIKTERLIEKGMDTLMDGRMIFIVAHRLFTVRKSKAILVLEKGKIIGRGSRDKLLEEKGGYYQLYAGQFELEQERWDIPGRTNKQIRLK